MKLVNFILIIFITLASSIKAEINKNLIKDWIRSLKYKSGYVFLGANFAKSGGVRNHLIAIEKYATLGVELVPNDDLIEQFSGQDFANKFKDLFFNFKPKKEQFFILMCTLGILSGVKKNKNKDIFGCILTTCRISLNMPATRL